LLETAVLTSSSGGCGKTLLGAELARRGYVVLTASPITNYLNSYRVMERYEIYDALKAYVDEGACDRCGECLEACTKGAITEDFKVIEGLCEGCPACAYACPRGAIKFKQTKGAEYEIIKVEEGFVIEVRVEPGLNELSYLLGLMGVARRLAEDNGIGTVLVETRARLPAQKGLFFVRKHPGAEDQVKEFELRSTGYERDAAVVVNVGLGDFDVNTSLKKFYMPHKEDPSFSTFVEEVVEWLESR